MTEISKQDIEDIKKLGTPVVCGTMRYVIPLDKLNIAHTFENPKDAGTEWGAQKLKGNGEDILLFNGLSKEQVQKLDSSVKEFENKHGKPITDMNIIEVKRFINDRLRDGFDDVYCSDKAYMQSSLTANDASKRVGLYARNKDQLCYAVQIPQGTTFKDDVKTQVANVEGALLIVDDRNDVRITNEPKDYLPRNVGAKIATLSEVKNTAIQMKTKSTSISY